MHLNRLLENPKVTVLSDVEVAKGKRRAELHVSGILCETVCVTRPTVALRKLPEVTSVSFDSDREAFVIDYESASSLTSRFERAILGAVIARAARAWLEAIARALKIRR